MSPEAFFAGPIAGIRDGDMITIDAIQHQLTLGITEEEMQARLREWKKPEPRYHRGVLAKYAQQVTSASEGAVTDKGL